MKTKIFNTMSGKLEEFEPINKDEVMIYTCGPTVYDYIHIGNARPMITFDCFRKYLEYRGYRVKYVQNFTDVDDKIIKKAVKEGKTYKDIALKYIGEYRKDAKGLGVSLPTIEPRASQSIEDIISIVKLLIDKGYGYERQGDVYFKTKKFKSYGKLSHMPIDDLRAGERVSVNDLKDDPLDFAVWKKSKENEPFWDSPWSKGRPGWHIECSAMAAHNLGTTIDIHCGGRDLIFPHHENEIAQSECAFSKTFSNYFMHNGYINIDNKKMSKSLGNFFTVREISDKYGYAPIRYIMLASHYRSPISYSEELVIQSKASIERIINFRDSINFAIQKAPKGDIKKEDKEFLENKKESFIKALDNDFNTADAISVIFEIIRYTNPYATLKQTCSQQFLQYARDIFSELTGVLGIISEPHAEDIPDDVVLLFEQRNKARQDRDYKLADELRDKIDAKGYAVEETRKGSRLKPKK